MFKRRYMLCVHFEFKDKGHFLNFMVECFGRPSYFWLRDKAGEILEQEGVVKWGDAYEIISVTRCK